VSKKSRNEARAKRRAQLDRKKAKGKAQLDYGKGQGASSIHPPVAVSTQHTGDKAKEASRQASPQEPGKPSKTFYRRFWKWIWGTGLAVLGIILPIAFQIHTCGQERLVATKEGQENIQSDTKDIKKQIESKTQANLPELEKRFPGGFKTFAVLTGGSATAGHTIIASSTSYSIDITWESAAVSELTPSNMTLQFQNVKIIRTQTTPAGTQPAGSIVINGKSIWHMNRRTKLVSTNNAIGFWGYVIGGLVLYDTNDELIVAVGLQNDE
jgi:hypothetical protein